MALVSYYFKGTDTYRFYAVSFLHVFLKTSKSTPCIQRQTAPMLSCFRLSVGAQLLFLSPMSKKVGAEEILRAPLRQSQSPSATVL